MKNVIIGQGLLPRLNEFLPAGKRVVAIVDSNVYALYGDTFRQFECIIVEASEEKKTLETMGKIYSQLIESGADRGVFILGVGGGIVTDIAGFAAATYMRGVDFGFVATTLLAQIDASVGGKNGVNIGGYKNMAGTFRQPLFVLSDVDLLDTLPEREFRAGMAEMIKAAIVGDAALFTLIENHDLRADKSLLINAIRAAVEVKIGIVERDETEQGERRKLNLGHTFGHAVEKLTRQFNHGEAVSIGIVEACRMSVERGLLEPSTAARIEGLLKKWGLPVETDLPRGELMKAIRHDKKADGDAIRFVLPRAIGEVEELKTKN